MIAAIKIGKYKIQCGFDATVIKLKSVGQNQWQAIGAIEIEPKVFAPHKWNIQGKSLFQTPEADLNLESYEEA